MKFHLYNIDAKDLGEDYTLGLEFVRYDAIYYSNDEVFWKTYFLNKRFVDSCGYVYRLVGKQRIEKWWLSLFHITRYRCIFESTGEHLSVDEVKDIVIRQISNSRGERPEVIIEGLKKAASYTDVFEWESVDDEQLTKNKNEQ